METCQENIISLELQRGEEEEEEEDTFAGEVAIEQALDIALKDSHEDDEEELGGSSIVTVKSNHQIGTNDDDCQVAKYNASFSTSATSSTTTNETTTTTTKSFMQTIVEVVNPVIAGDGFANTIPIGRLADGSYPSMDYPDDADEDDEDQLEFESHEAAAAAAGSDDEYNYSGQHELSMNDKMKNVLQELLTNERVQLNWSRSQEEAEDDERNTHSNEDDDEHSFSTENSTIRSLRFDDNSFDSNRNLDCQVYSNPGADVAFQTRNEASGQLGDIGKDLTNPKTEQLLPAMADNSGIRSTNGHKKKKNKNKNRKNKK